MHPFYEAIDRSIILSGPHNLLHNKLGQRAVGIIKCDCCPLSKLESIGPSKKILLTKMFTKVPAVTLLLIG